ncbi:MULTISPECIES: hypothetical protein [unclassified Aureimonas]|uniref:hypothetical protein n=1 Tax=unclassified Aureimonas TaxID=2615206 RepID=UPI0006F36B24|nr:MULTISPECIES: hypothetical protein [unclassified Aureimonas]KQT53872.1 hypothetical protein ASG62_11585 [Aureimonas sp. Leaf427]KQT71686.1 hypothetical protein ASG54_19575 [Aureimonas sp. Leaf460]
MSTLQKTIVEHASASDLPDRFRGDLAPGTPVTVIVLAEDEPTRDERPRYLRYWGVASHLGTTTEESVARVRALRDEWD